MFRLGAFDLPPEQRGSDSRQRSGLRRDQAARGPGAGGAQSEGEGVGQALSGADAGGAQKEFFWGTAVEAAHLARLPSPPRQTNQAAGCGHRRPVHAPGNVQPAAGKKAPGPLEAQSCPGDGRRRVLLRVFVRRVLTAPLSLRHQVLSGLRPLLRDARRQ